MPRNRKKKTEKKFNNAYAAINAENKLPRCELCKRGFVTLKSIKINGTTVMACPACQASGRQSERLGLASGKALPQ